MSGELLTGATGFLGSYLLRDALAAGRPVAVLARRGRAASAEQRVAELVARFQRQAPAALAAPTVIEGDLHQPGLGLDRGARTWIAEHCDRVVHCGASITFRARNGEPYLSNVDGTRYLLELCREAGIRDFHLVSTAYVCGRREGVVMEDDLERGQEFSNDYERSKYMSETLVRQAPFLDRWSVYRPSVIVGDSATGFASTRDGLYAFLSVAGLAEGRSRDEVFARLGMRAEDRVNLVPVEWVSAVIGHLAARSGRQSETYHLTHPRPVTAGALLDAASGLAARAPAVDPRALDELLDVYRPYLKQHCGFDVTHTRRDAPELECPVLEGEVLERLVGFLATRAPAAADAAAPPDAVGERVRVHCSGETWERLVREEMTVEQALYAGVLALEGEPAAMAHATRLLERHLAAARSGAAPARAEAMA